MTKSNTIGNIVTSLVGVALALYGVALIANTILTY
jgi:hypothetical protein